MFSLIFGIDRGEGLGASHLLSLTVSHDPAG